MHAVCLCLRSLAAALMLPAMIAGVPQASAQDRPKVEIVPNIPHSLWIRTVAVSPDGTRLLSGGTDKSIKLWDMASGQLLRTYDGYSQEVTSVAFSPDGTHMLSASADQFIKLWDITTGEVIRAFTGHLDQVSSIVFSPDGARFLSGSFDNTLKLWDVASGQVIRTFEGTSARSARWHFRPMARASSPAAGTRR